MPVSATKALRKAAVTGEKLPLPPAMTRVVQAGGVFRRGQLVTVGGVSNAGKSAFAQWIAAETNVETLYFSADQDPRTTATRLSATLTGATVHQVSTALDQNEFGYFEEAMSRSNLRFCFDPSPSLDDMQLELDAYVDTFDAFPKLIVVDNLVNVDISGENLADQYILSELHKIARNTQACVLVLIHASENSTPENKAPRKKDLINKASKYQELIITVALDDTTSDFYVVIAKTREGKSDPNARRPIVMGSNFSIQQFYASPQTAWGGGGWE